MKTRFLPLASAFCLLTKCVFADFFIQDGKPETYLPFSSLQYWKTESGEAAAALPGKSDRLADRHHYYFDLEGKTHQLDGWRTMSGWGRWHLGITNGVLEFLGTSTHHGGKMFIERGATLRYASGAKIQLGVDDAGPRQFLLREGGKLVFAPESKIEIYNTFMQSDAGSLLEFGTGEVRITGGGQRSKIENSGTLRMLKGFALGEGKGRSASLEIVQKAGLWEVAGAVSTNLSPSSLRVTLSGGIVRALADAPFAVSKLDLEKGADLLLETPEGVFLAFPTLTKCGAGAKITKQGAGVLKFGTRFPESFEVAEGVLEINTPGVLHNFEKIRFAPGTKLILAAPGLSAERAPQGDFMLALNPEAYRNGDSVFSSGDEAFLARIQAAARNLPYGLHLVKQGNTLVLASRYENRGSGTWDAAATWKSAAVPPSGMCVTISGKGNVVRIAPGTRIPQCRSILVTGGATLEVCASGILPYVTLEGDSKLVFGDGTAAATADLRNGLSFRAEDGVLPLVEIRADARVVLAEGTALEGCRLTNEGSFVYRMKKTLKTWVDNMNRSFYVDASELLPDGARYSFQVPVFWDVPALAHKRTRNVETQGPVFRGRLPKVAGEKSTAKPFPVRVFITDREGIMHIGEGEVTPNPFILKQPAPNHEILVGQTVYRAYTVFAEEIIRDELCNLLVMWKTDLPLRLDEVAADLREKAKQDGMYFMTIYGNTPRENVDSIRAVHGDRYLFNNVGEYCGYLYQGQSSAGSIPQDMDLKECKEHFINTKLQKGLRHYRSRYDYLFSTSGSPLANYELQGGIEYICNELYAVGSANLAYASSEARGAARRWGPEYWCSWLAQEWQTFPLPYNSDQNFDSLLAGLYQQYVMGTSLMVLESGAQSSQAHHYKNYEPGGEKGFRQWYNDWAPTRYRETVKHFYNVTRKLPRAEGTPETKVAFLLGEGGAYVGMTHPMFAMWAQHEQAKTNQNWRCGLPEWTWNKIKTIFYPVPSDNLAPYPNHWLAGSPYGQCDVVCVDEDAYYADISRYSLLSFVGWNTMTPVARNVLNYYVQRGGTLVEALPHSSTRRDREHTNYLWQDLEESMRKMVKPDPVTVSGTLEILPGAERFFPQSVALLAQDTGAFKDFILAELTPEASAQWIPLAAVGGKPLLVVRKEGAGMRFLFLGWQYPGHHGAYPAFFGNVLRELVRQVPKSVVIEAAEKGSRDADYICYGVYRDAVYFVNMDCVKERSFIAKTSGGKEARFTLPPCTLIMTTPDLKEGFRSADLPPSVLTERFTPPTREQAEEWEKTRAHTR